MASTDAYNTGLVYISAFPSLLNLSGGTKMSTVATVSKCIILTVSTLYVIATCLLEHGTIASRD